MKHLLVFVLIAFPVVAFAGPKEKQEAKKHINKATEAHQAGQFDVALTELQTAYGLDPQPDLLYAMGQVQVKLAKCEDAIASYEKFLATNPPADAATSANEAIETCKAQLPPPPPPEPTPEPTPPPQPPPQPVPESKPFYTDKIGTALVGAGVVSMVVGVVMYSSAVSTLDDAEMATTYDKHDELVSDAHMKRNIGLAFGVIGLAAVGVGVWHYTSFVSEQSVMVTPTSSGGTVTWMGRF